MPIATQDALTGLGMAPQLASRLGANPLTTNGAGVAQATAAVLKSKNTELNPAGSATGFIPPSDAALMEPYNLTNQQATSAVVYVPVGHTLNGTLNGSVTVAQTKSVILWQYKVKNWTYILTA